MDGLAAQGFGPDRTALLGFSQGACLALEYAARAVRAPGVVAGLSGGLVGTAEADGGPRAELHGHAPKRFDYAGRLEGVRVFIGCHERDPHIPLARVRESEAVLRERGAEVRVDIHPGAGHGVLEQEIRVLRGLLQR
jgi:phospholipase/carboxylesterase